MAEKKKLDIFAKTEPTTPPTDNSDLDEGPIKPIGVGVREGEVLALDKIAEHYGVARNAILRFAVRFFIQEFRAGNIDISQYIYTPPTPSKKIKFPK